MISLQEAFKAVAIGGGGSSAEYYRNNRGTTRAQYTPGFSISIYELLLTYFSAFAIITIAHK
jgi:hypothetical protein